MSIVVTARKRITNMLSESLYDNPVVIKAFRTRMRGWKAFVTMGAYVGLMSIVLLVAYFIVADMYSHGMGSYVTVNITVGKSLFYSLTWAQAFLLTLIIPALSSGAITHELEKKTIEMLALTPLSAGKIVLGKQIADFLYAVILLICSVPLAGICLMLGGISPMEIAVTYMLLVAWAFLMTCSAVMWSSLTKKTATASGNNFGLCLLYFILTLTLPGSLMIASYATHRSYTGFPFLLLNPAYASTGVLQSTSVCGIHISLALVATVLHVACGVLFLLIATTHVKYRVVERALPIRLLLIGLTVLIVWLSVGSVTGNIDMSSLAEVGATLLVIGMVFSAIFATGPLKKPEGGDILNYVLSPRRAFLTDVGGSIGFLSLWTTLAYATFGVSALMWRATAKSLPMTGKIAAGFWPGYFKVGIATIVIVAATAAIGVLASAMTKKRGSAAALVVLFVVVAFAGFAIVAAVCESIPSGDHAVAAQLAALWPATPVTSVVSGPAAMSDPTFRMPRWFKDGWLVTSVIYAIMGAIAIALASFAYRKAGGVVVEE